MIPCAFSLDSIHFIPPLCLFHTFSITLIQRSATTNYTFTVTHVGLTSKASIQVQAVTLNEYFEGSCIGRLVNVSIDKVFWNL